MKSYTIRKSKEYYDQTKKLLAGGVHHNFNHKDTEIPICFVKGNKSRVWDADGNEYMDLAGKSGSLILGHNHAIYNETLKECISRISAVDNTDMGCEVYTYLNRYVPCAETVRFGLSGTEMVQNALRLARAYTMKNKILKFEGHYHGSADNILGGKAGCDFIPFDDGKGIFSTRGRSSNILSDQLLIAPWNDVNLLEQVVDKYQDEIAAIIAEPVCINGGGIMPQDNFLRELRRICDRKGIVLIFDEVITGIRMGLGCAQEYFKVTPDICILGKSVAGGSVPVSVICGKKDIMKLYEDAAVVQGGTFNGYPLGLAAIKATFAVLTNHSEEHYQRLKNYSNKIYTAFIEEAKQVGLEVTIQGPESCSVLHCSSAIKQYSDYTDSIVIKNNIIRECFKKYGIIISSISKIYPNITLNEEDVEFTKERIKQSFADAAIVMNKLKLTN